MSLRALARFCYRRRRLVVGIWIAALIGVNVLASVLGTNFTTNFSAPNTESTRAANLLRANFKAQSGDSVQVVFEGNPGVCNARQKGTEASTGEIVVSADADTTLSPDWLAKIDRLFGDDASIAAVVGPCRYKDGPLWGRVYGRLLFGWS